MAHDLNYNTTNNEYSFFSVKEKAWHGLGKIVAQYPTSAEAIKFAGLDYTVEKRPLFTYDSENHTGDPETDLLIPEIEVSNYFATTEELCRKLTGYKVLAVTDSVKIWCGTFGSLTTYKKKGITISVPEYYFKVIEYYDSNVGGMITQTYWMPNKSDATRKTLSSCQISYSALIKHLGFSPKRVFNEL